MFRFLSLILLAVTVSFTACNKDTTNPAHSRPGAGAEGRAVPAAAKPPVADIPPTVLFNNFEIFGSTTFVTKTKEALSLLEGSTTFTKISPYIAVIEEADHSGMAAYTLKPTFKVGSATWNRGAAWYAGTIAHDGYHSLMYHKAKGSGAIEPPDNAWTGTLAEQKCLAVQAEVLIEIKADKYLVDYVTRLISSPTYQNVAYDKRNW